jgi:glyoxylase I family protein
VLLHHLAFRTENIPALRAFYQGLLGLHLTRVTETGSVWLRSGPVILMLEKRGAHEPTVCAGSMDMIAFQIDAHMQPALRKRLIDAGHCVEAETSFTFYVRDPDGRRIGISSYVFESL